MTLAETKKVLVSFALKGVDSIDGRRIFLQRSG